MEHSALDRLLAPGGITPVYQPIYAVSDGPPHRYGYECLSRGPRGTNFESPDVLFDYVRLKRQEIVVDRACIAAALRQLPHLEDGVRISINVHASTLGRDPTFTEFLAGTCRDTRVAPSQVTVEIVEHAPPWDNDSFLRALAALRHLGASIALDDVGLGQSNFKMLLDASPEFLKLDRYFVDGCSRDPKRCAVISSIEELARRFGARVIAEGVETEEDLMTVRELGIDLVQGFFFSKPLPAAELTVN
ncbi:MAG TPA: EAL domain-containing protein [Thermoanaerobaculia bacterium]|nr:EAL domain-containing protein [Thermoanaerobaculia bacterium]